MHLFRNTTILASFLLLSLLVVALYIQSFHILVTPNENRSFKKIGHLPESIFQYRSGVSKDLWLKNDVHCHLESPSSALRFSFNTSDPSLIETFSQTKVWIQNPKGGSRYFKLNESELNYSEKTLNATEFSGIESEHP